MGRVNIDVMKRFMHLQGMVAELGVNRGSSSRLMIPVAEEYNKIIWLCDSFRGMPSSHNVDDLKQYPKGKFGNANPNDIMKLSDYVRLRILVGWLPESIMAIKGKYCFVYLDLDHYEGTSHTLRVLWHKITMGGAILCDDYFPGKQILATKAIDEFIAECDDLKITQDGNQMLLEKV